MKRFFLTWVVMALCAVSSTALAYDITFNDINYNYINGGEELEVTHGYYFDSIVIPEKVTYDNKTMKVTSIGELAFSGCSALSSVTIPNSVTSIGEEAFSGCYALTSVTIPNSVTSIGEKAFSGCRSLTNVTIPGSVTSIGDYAFYSCSGLKSLTIPNSVTSIGDYAFCNCSGLTSVTIPESVTSIGDYTFDCCIRLTSVTIPNSVTSIGRSAFEYCSGLTSVTIPNSVTSIGEQAFSGCSSLTDVIIPGSVTSIGDYAFYDCSGLTSVTIPESVTSIGSWAFWLCSGLTSVTIPNSVTSIGDRAFSGCSKLKLVIIPNSVTSIGEEAFSGCSGLTSVAISNSVTEIRSSTFYGCSGLTSVAIPNSVTSFGNSAFSGCSALTSVIIPNSVTSIGEEAFSGCSALTSVTIPNSVTEIRNSTFYGCSSLTSVTIPNSVTSFGNSAFSGCSSLTDVIIPERVTSIGEEAFSGCSSLTNVYYDAESVPKTGNNAFLSSNIGNATLYVPLNAVNNYKATSPWSGFKTIDAIDGLISPGKYYLQLEGTNKYLAAANDWGTQASLNDTGIDIILERYDSNPDAFKLNTNINNNITDFYLNIADNSSIYCDQPKGKWHFINMEDGTYALTMDDENYLGHDENYSKLTLTKERTRWRLVTEEERKAAMSKASSNNPIDATFLLPCANFGRNDTRIEAWMGKPKRNGNARNMNGEKYNTTCDVYQILTGLPIGWYKVKMQGFYREGADENGQITSVVELRKSGQEHLYAQFYANYKSMPVQSIFDCAGQCGTTGLSSEFGCIPNSQSDASAYFDAGLYEHELMVYVDNGELRIGVRKETVVARDWTCFDNFRLIYMGNESVNFDITSQKIVSNWYANGSMEPYSGLDEMHVNHYQPGNLDRSGIDTEVTDNKEFIFNLLSGFKNGTGKEVTIVFDIDKYNQGITQDGLSGRSYTMTATNDMVYASYNGSTFPVVRLMDKYKDKEGRWIEFQNNDFANDLLNAAPIFNADGKTTDAFFTEMTLTSKHGVPMNLTGDTDFRVRYLRPIDIAHVHTGKAYMKDGAEAGYDAIHTAEIFTFTDWRQTMPFGYNIENQPTRETWMQFYGIREIYFNMDEVESDSEGKVEPLEDPNLDLAIAYRTPREELYDDRERFRNHIGFVRYQNNGGAVGSYNLFIPFHIVHNWGEVVIRVQVPIVGTFDDEKNIRWLDVEDILATSVVLNKTEMNLAIGRTEQLTATVEPTDATNRNVTWRSTDVTVVTVDHDGLVTAVGNGKAQIIATTADGSNKTASCFVTVSLPGDVNGDGKVNGADIVAVINYVLNNSTDTRGDVNNDGKVNGADIVAVINYVLNFTGVKAAQPWLLQAPSDEAAEMSASCTHEGIALDLAGGTAFTAFQMMLSLPEGVSLNSVQGSRERLDKHELLFQHQADGRYLVLGYAADNRCIEGTTGRLLSLLTDKKVNGTAVLSDILLFTPKATTKQLPALSIDVTTGVEELEDGQLNTTNDGHIYDLGGRLVLSSDDYERHPEILRTGIYVRNGHKFVVK